MLKQRIITALVLAPIMIGGIFFLPLEPFMIFIGVITAVGAWEWANMSGVSSTAGRALYVLGVVFALIALAYSGLEQAQWLLWAALIWWLFAFLLVRTYPSTKQIWTQPPMRLLIGLIVLLPMWVGFVQIKAYPGSSLLIMFVMLLVWGADIGAYFAGRSFGKNKLAPNVSPGKTWEGVFGGMLATLTIAVLGGLYLQWHIAEITLTGSQWLSLFITTIIVTVVSVLGDLVESMVKRHRGIKDSSNLLPGHGGVMDRIDSMTAALPVFALALTLLSWDIFL